MDATRIRSFTFWLLGDLSQATASSLWIASVATIAGVVALTLKARPLNLLMLGERDAFDLGVEVERVRVQVFLAASLLVGVSVALSGSVGYVGLVVPHLVRMSTGGDNRLTIPAAALAGAAFVVVGRHCCAHCDCAARTTCWRDHGVDWRALVYLFAEATLEGSLKADKRTNTKFPCDPLFTVRTPGSD